MELLLGTTNPGKVKEYRYIFKEWPNISLFEPADFGIKEKPNETGETFEENALLKARFYCKRAKIPALGDDAGIEIDALRGEPGVKTRRWLGHECTDEELIHHCLERLTGVPKEKRGALFRVVVAIVFPDGEIYIGEGTERGHIAEQQIEKLDPGYPFRSIFIRDDLRESETSNELEEGHNHRKQAIEKIRKQLHNP